MFHDKPLSYLSVAAGFDHFPGFFHGFNPVEPLCVLHHIYALGLTLVTDHAERPVRLSQVQFLLRTKSGQSNLGKYCILRSFLRNYVTQDCKENLK